MVRLEIQLINSENKKIDITDKDKYTLDKIGIIIEGEEDEGLQTIKYIIPWTSIVMCTETEIYDEAFDMIDLNYEGIMFA